MTSEAHRESIYVVKLVTACTARGSKGLCGAGGSGEGPQRVARRGIHFFRFLLASGGLIKKKNMISDGGNYTQAYHRESIMYVYCVPTPILGRVHSRYIMKRVHSRYGGTL